MPTLFLLLVLSTVANADPGALPQPMESCPAPTNDDPHPPCCPVEQRALELFDADDVRACLPSS